MNKGWLRGAALVSSLSIAVLLVARASTGCGGEGTGSGSATTPSITPERSASGASAAPTASGAGAVESADSADSDGAEFFGTGKSGPVHRKRPSQPSQQPASSAP